MQGRSRPSRSVNAVQRRLAVASRITPNRKSPRLPLYFRPMANTFQSPPGTRDFYPEQMALRRYFEDAWRRVSLRHGFVEIDGPTFEFLDLYKVKSGDEIVSQLFHFESREDKSGN